MSAQQRDPIQPALRFAYVGTQMNWSAHAFEVAHRARRDDVRWYSSPDDLPRQPAPDVVIHCLFEHNSAGPLAPCDLAALLPPTTLLVTICGGNPQPAEILAVRHIYKGNCHPKSMLYVPGPTYGCPSDVLRLYDQALAEPAGVWIEGDVEKLPLPPADADAAVVAAVPDLGEVMVGSPRMARLLVAAATECWSGWRQLAERSHYAIGTVRNIHNDLGEELKRVGLVDLDEEWTAQRFAGFATTHSLFILSFANGHLGIDF